MSVVYQMVGGELTAFYKTGRSVGKSTTVGRERDLLSNMPGNRAFKLESWLRPRFVGLACLDDGNPIRGLRLLKVLI